MLKAGTIKKQITTYKSQFQRKNYNVYTFYVSPEVNKFQLKDSLEKVFNVKIEKITSLRLKPTLKNVRRNVYTKMKKKVFVKLRPGYNIEDLISNKTGQKLNVSVDKQAQGDTN